MAEVLVLQHVACEPLGTIENALEGAGLQFRYVRGYAGDPVPPDMGEASGLVVMGGPMGAYDQDRFPFLADEMELIQTCLTRQLPVLGVCLGSQLLAAVLGATVRRGSQPEIGWHRVALTEAAVEDAVCRFLPSEFTSFHWHGDTFDIPPGAVSLASSALTPCQAFRFGSAAYGFQFHMEVTEPIIQDWTAAFADELVAAGLTATAIQEAVPEFLLPLQEVAQGAFGQWAKLAAGQICD